jgi:hypothetical protein
VFLLMFRSREALHVFLVIGAFKFDKLRYKYKTGGHDYKKQIKKKNTLYLFPIHFWSRLQKMVEVE